MPGIPDSSDSLFSDAEQRSNLLIVLVCCLGVLALLIGEVSLLVHRAIKGPTPPYQVGFSTVGNECRNGSDSEAKGLILDWKSGEILYCGLVPGIGGDPAGSGGEFSGNETARVTGLAKSLASKGRL